MSRRGGAREPAQAYWQGRETPQTGMRTDSPIDRSWSSSHRPHSRTPLAQRIRSLHGAERSTGNRPSAGNRSNRPGSPQRPRTRFVWEPPSTLPRRRGILAPANGMHIGAWGDRFLPRRFPTTSRIVPSWSTVDEMGTSGNRRLATSARGLRVVRSAANKRRTRAQIGNLC
jgi:hypothetical protein